MTPIVAIVDDDQSVREAMQRMLRTHSFSTVVFASAEQFLGSDATQQAGCLILDMRMPAMTGMALHQHLVSQGCRIPTILITASPTSAERSRAIASGIVSYLAKPLSEEALLDAVRAALEEDGQGVGATRPERGTPRV